MTVWRHKPQFDTLAPALHSWFETELGRSVLAVEQRLLERCLTDCFGYYLLQLGIDSDMNFYRDCRIQRCFRAGPMLPKMPVNDTRAAFVRCNFEELPFESDSLDVVVAHHVVEFSTDPHAVLRELYRVTVPHGRIILVGFNPWSLFGLRMAVGRWQSDSIWRNHWLSAPRVQDWLQLLGFEVEHIDYGFHRLPLQRAANWAQMANKATNWSRHWPGGGIYAVTAIKQVAKFIPMRPLRLRPASVLAPLPVAKPSTTVGQRRIKQR
jgi:SAM-dependent methyltransferase